MTKRPGGGSRAASSIASVAMVPFLLPLLALLFSPHGAARALDQGPGTSEPGEIIGSAADPGALPEAPQVPAERPARGYELDPAIGKGLPPPAGPRPRVVHDGGAGAPASEPTSTADLTLLESFQGIGPTGSIPADPILAAGPNHVVQCVNSAFRISTKGGATVGGATFSNWWGSLVPGVVPFDPWIVYDHFSSRWVMMAIDRRCAQSDAWYFISTSHTSDPTGAWCRWALPADLDGDVETDDWADYPKIGFDATNLYITSNQFGCQGGFSYSKVRVMRKSQFYENTCGAIKWYDFVDLRNADGSLAFTVQPAVTFGSPGKEYIINAYSGSSNLVTLWSITGTWPNPSDTPPVLTREATVTVGGYSLPPDASQCGGLTPLHTGDARLMNAVYRDGRIFTCHAIEDAGHAVVRYLAIDVSSRAVTLDEAIGSPGYDYYYPAVMVDGDGNILTVFSRSSAAFAECAGIYYAGRARDDTSFRESVALKQGEAPYIALDARNRNRWGDFAGIAVDPTDSGRLWFFSDFARSPSSSWGTWLGSIEFPPPPPPVPAATLDLQASPNPAVAGQPFRLVLDITSEGPAFTGTLLNLLYVSATPIVVGYLPGVPFAVDLSVTDAPLLSVPSYPALPPHLYLLLLFDNATSDLVAYAFEVVG